MKNQTAIFNRLNASNFQKQIKFVRRKDLTSLVRLQIAYMALMAQTFKDWGTITALSGEFQVSRTFIYMTLLIY